MNNMNSFYNESTKELTLVIKNVSKESVLKVMGENLIMISGITSIPDAPEPVINDKEAVTQPLEVVSSSGMPDIDDIPQDVINEALEEAMLNEMEANEAEEIKPESVESTATDSKEIKPEESKPEEPESKAEITADLPTAPVQYCFNLKGAATKLNMPNMPLVKVFELQCKRLGIQAFSKSKYVSYVTTEEDRDALIKAGFTLI